MKLNYLEMRWTLLSGIACAAVSAWGSPASAQNATAPAKGADNQAAATGEIIVTAQRRSESLSKTPVSAAVLSSDTLEKAQIISEQDLRAAVPGLTVRAGISANQLNYALRGQTLDAFSDGAPGVLPYINDVQVNGSGDGGATAFYDLQSVQVLKGPQGTLFGRSAIGGAVLFTTQKPKEDFGGYIDGTLGDNDLKKVEGAINVPLIKEKLLLRVAGFYEHRDGYQYNIFTNSRIGGLNRFGLRGSLTAKFGENIKNDLVVDYSHLNSQNEAAVLYNFGVPYNPANPGASNPLVIPAYNVQTYYGPGGIGVVPRTAPTPGAPLVSCDQPFAGGYNPLCGNIVQNLVDQVKRGPFVVNVNGADFYRVRTTLVTNTTAIDLGGGTQIKNIFGYQSSRTDGATDQDDTAYTIMEQPASYRSDQVSEELQILGKTLNDRLKYVAGGYFSSDKKYGLQPGFTYVSIFGPFPATANYTKRSKIYAGYAQGTYDLSDLTGIGGLGFTAGVRYTRETPSIQVESQSQFFAQCSPGEGHVNGQACFQEKTVDNVGWTIGLQDQVNSKLLVYAVTRRSYRDGGYNAYLAPFVGTGIGTGGPGGDGGSAPPKGNGFVTETLTDAEIGVKYAGSIGTVPARVNLAGYTSWSRNSQHTAYGLIGGALAAYTINVPKAKISGVEADTTVSPAHWLNLGGALTYTDAKFTDGLIDGVDFATYPDTPRWSGNVFAEVIAPLTRNIDATLHGEYYAQKFTYGVTNANLNTGAVYPGFGIANLRLTIEDRDAGWSLTGNVKNLFNKIYYAGGETLGVLQGFNTVVPGDPRTWTVEARFKF
jgi:iron complex outermembrane receptor protein